eukprot:3370786-Rhodomonas_salina.1
MKVETDVVSDQFYHGGIHETLQPERCKAARKSLEIFVSMIFKKCPIKSKGQKWPSCGCTAHLLVLASASR